MGEQDPKLFDDIRRYLDNQRTTDKPSARLFREEVKRQINQLLDGFGEPPSPSEPPHPNETVPLAISHRMKPGHMLVANIVNAFRKASSTYEISEGRYVQIEIPGRADSYPTYTLYGQVDGQENPDTLVADLLLSLLPVSSLDPSTIVSAKTKMRECMIEIAKKIPHTQDFFTIHQSDKQTLYPLLDRIGGRLDTFYPDNFYRIESELSDIRTLIRNAPSS